MRHWLMQLSLWLILAATLGVAELVRRQYMHANQVELTRATVVGNITAEFPGGWGMQALADGVLLIEPEQAGRRPSLQRRMEIHRGRTSNFISPLEYLVRTGELPAHDAAEMLSAEATPREGRSAGFSSIRMAGGTGVMLSQTRLALNVRKRQAARRKQVLACTILPTGDALLVQLEGPGSAESGDEELVRRVAESLRLKEQGPWRSPGANRQEFGVGVPELMTLDANDNLRTSRTFIVGNAPEWLAVNITPCIILDEPAAALKSMLLLRDISYDPADVRQVEERVWMCPRRPEAIFPGVSYLMADASGEAVLAEFRWDAPGGWSTAAMDQVEWLWERIHGSIDLPGQSHVAERLRVGEAAVEGLPRDPAELLGEGRSWMWQWYDEHSPRTTSMEITYTLGAEELECIQRTGHSPPLGASGEETVTWRMLREGGRYDYACVREGALSLLEWQSRLAQGRLYTRVFHNSRKRVDSRSADLGPFIPGGLLPLALGRLPARPMILRTESLPGFGPTSAPLILVMTPATDDARQGGREGKPARTWTIEVSGTGMASRWSLEESGRLTSIGFPGGVHLQRVGPREKKDHP